MPANSPSASTVTLNGFGELDVQFRPTPPPSKPIEPAWSKLDEWLRLAASGGSLSSGFANKAISDASEGDRGAACEVHADPRKGKIDPLCPSGSAI
jgi:hypothetical protein